MATAILVPARQSEVSDPASMINGFFLPTGSADAGTCMRGLNDGEYLASTPTTAQNDFVAAIFIDDGVTLPLGATINSVKARMNISGSNFSWSNSDGSGNYIPWLLEDDLDDPFTTNYILFSGIAGAGPYTVPSLTIYDSDVYPLCPCTGLAWTRNDLFNFGGTSTTNGKRNWLFFNFVTNTGDFKLDYFALVVDYTAAITDVWYFNPATDKYQYTDVNPGAPWIVQSPTSTFALVSVDPTSGSTVGG